jgi:hypothetical protein
MVGGKSHPIARCELIKEIAGYIERHQGPDEEGFAHPTRRQLTLDQIIDALSIASVPQAVKPIHFRKTRGLLQDSRYRQMIARKKLSQLLADERFGGSLSRVLRECDNLDLSTPITETIAGTQRQIITSTLFSGSNYFGGNPYDFLAFALEASGKQDIQAQFRRYHRANVSLHYLDNGGTEEMVRAKGDQIAKEHFDGHPQALLASPKAFPVFGPFRTNLAGEECSVSMQTVARKLNNSRATFLRIYQQSLASKSPR